jgi:hypothetical protein
VCCLSGSLGLGCSGEASIRTELPSEPGASPDAGEDEPVYALHAIVFDPDYNATSYVLPTHTFDLNEISRELGLDPEGDHDFSGGHDEDVAGELDEHGRLFDLENETATEVEGIGAMKSGFDTLGRVSKWICVR